MDGLNQPHELARHTTHTTICCVLHLSISLPFLGNIKKQK